MCFSDLDFSTLQDIPPTGRFHDTPRVSVSAAGRVAMNRAFCKLAARTADTWCSAPTSRPASDFPPRAGTRSIRCWRSG